MTLEVEIKVSPCDDSLDGCRRKLILFQHSFGVNVSNGWTPEANPTFPKCAGMPDFRSYILFRNGVLKKTFEKGID